MIEQKKNIYIKKNLIKESKLNFFIFLYSFLLLLSLLLDRGISDYGYLLPPIFASFSIFLYFSNKAIGELVVIFASFALVYIVAPTNLLFGILISLNVFLVLRLIDIAKMPIPSRILYNYYIICIIYICLNIVLSFSSYFYEDTESHRFIGAFKSINSTQSIILLMLIFCLEYIKSQNISITKRKTFIILFIFIYLYFLNISKTRTNLFLIPYIIYNICLYFNKKHIFVILILFILYITLINTLLIDKLFETYRIGSDSSLETRQNLYDAIFYKLKQNNYILPLGFNKATEYTQAITENSNFSAHNDFLRYWLEWGGLFFIFILLLFLRLKSFFKKNINNICILLFFISCGLHNILIAPHVLIPLFFILCLYNNKISKQEKNFQ